MPDSDSSSSPERSVRSTDRVTRRNWLQMAGAGGVAALAGCSGDGNDDGNGTTTDGSDGVTTIEYWRWPHSTEPSNTGEDEIVQAFNEGPGAEQGIEVEQVTNPFGDHNSALRTAIGGNDAPALAWSQPANLYDYVGKDRETIEENAPFAFIEDYIDDEFRDQFYDPVWDWQEQRFKGLIGVPFIASLSPGVLYVNVDAWNEAGLGDLPEGSWSYEEYLSAAEQLHGTEVNGSRVNGVGVGLADAVSNDEWDNYLSVLSRTAGSLVGTGYQNQDDEYVLTAASDPELDAWNSLLGTPIENGWTNNPGAYEFIEMQEPFTAGQIGMLHHTTYTRIEVSSADFEWDIIPYPTKGGEENYGLYSTGSFNFTFNAFSEDVGGSPEEAMEFIKFRTNAENMYNWFNTSSQSVPNQAAYEMMVEDGVSDFVEETGGLEIMDRIDDAMGQYQAQQEAIIERYPDVKTTETGTPVTSMPLSLGSGRVHDIMGSVLQQQAQNNNANIQESLTNAEEEWGQLIEDADDLAVDQDSIGYNRPEPQAGPL